MIQLIQAIMEVLCRVKCSVITDLSKHDQTTKVKLIIQMTKSVELFELLPGEA